MKHLLVIALTLCVTTAELETAIEHFKKEAYPPQNQWRTLEIKGRAQSLRNAADELDKKDTDKAAALEIYRRFKKNGICPQ